MGGKTAQLVAGRNVLQGLKGLVLLATAPPTPLELPPEMKHQQVTAYSSPVSAEFVVRNVLSSPGLSDEQVANLVQDMLKGNEFARAVWPEYGMSESILEEAKKIRVPVLVIGGEQDRVEPVERLRKEVLGNIEGAEIVIVNGKGHLLPVEAPEEIAAFVEGFVEKLIH